MSEDRRESVSENLAPHFETAKAADDIYGRLTFANGNAPLIDPNVEYGTRGSFEESPAGEDTQFESSPWISAILFIRTDDSMTPVLESCVPAGKVCL